ncbi:hypothetical protein C4G80_RS06310 [Vibrio parahaemolyticus]|nr:hypothetical protein [Vibrio parahaemolyticus]
MIDSKDKKKKKKKVTVAYYNGVYATGSSARVAKDNAKKNSNYQENVSYICERETRETRAVIRKTKDARANKHKLAQKYSKYSQKSNDSSECDSHKSY